MNASKSARSTSTLVWLLVLGACGRAPIGDVRDDAADDDAVQDDDGAQGGPANDEGLPPCDGPYCSDPANCGALGVTCPRTFTNPGECHAGRCASGSGCLSELFDPDPDLTCDVACASGDVEGTTCLERGCAGHTAYKFPDIETCGGLPDELTPIDLACDEPIDFDALGGLSMRCCCIAP